MASSKELGQRLLEEFARPYDEFGVRLRKNNNMLPRARNLIQNGADLSETNSDGQTALIASLLNGYEEVARAIVENGGVDINCKDSFGDTALILAVNSTAEFIEFLLDHGADVTAANNSANTALHRACVVGSVEVVSLLLKSGASREATNNLGETPLLTAAKSGGRRVCDLLLMKGANPLATDARGGGLLHQPARLGNHVLYVHLRDKKGASEDIVDNEGKTSAQVLEEVLQVKQQKKLEKELESQYLSKVPRVVVAGGLGKVEEASNQPPAPAIGERVEENENQIDLGAGMGEVEKYQALVADLRSKVEETDEWANSIYQKWYDTDRLRIIAENNHREAQRTIESLQRQLVEQRREADQKLSDLMNRLDIAEKSVGQSPQGAPVR